MKVLVKQVNLYHNLGPEQRRAQQLVELYNNGERLWENLAGKRRLRRKLFPRLSRKEHKQVDLLDFAAACPPQDCVGWIEKSCLVLALPSC